MRTQFIVSYRFSMTIAHLLLLVHVASELREARLAAEAFFSTFRAERQGRRAVVDVALVTPRAPVHVVRDFRWF